MNPVESALKLVGPIYDAAADPQLWPQVLQKLADVLEGVTAVISLESTARPGQGIVASIRTPEDFQKSYVEHFQQINPWAQRGAHLMQAGTVSTPEMVLSVGETAQSEYYQDFLRPQGLFHAVGLVVEVRDRQASVVSSHRSRRKGPYTEEHFELLRLLWPHFERAARG
jgi:hypothetical protein